MELKDGINKLAELISKFNSSDTPIIANFIDAKLVDGSIIRYEVLEVGQKVFIIDESGIELPAPDNEYELEDGNIITVKDGVIMEISTKEEEAPEEEPVPVVAPSGMNEEEKADFEAHKKEIEAKFSAMENELKIYKEIIKETFSVIETFSKIPSSNPIEVKNNNPFKKQITREEQIQSLINNFKK